VALQQAEMRTVRWTYGIKVKDRFASKELRERLRINNITLVQQQNRLWYGHVLRKGDDWVKKCMKYQVEGPTPRKTKEDLERGCGT